MTRLFILLAALATLGCLASVASAATDPPATGTWRGTVKGGSDVVAFNLAKKGTTYRVGTLRLTTAASCAASNGLGPVVVETIRLKLPGGTFKSGQRFTFRGTAKLTDGRKRAIVLKVAFSSGTSAKALASVKESKSSTDKPICNSSFRVTVKHKS